MTEGERTKFENDMRMIPQLIECIQSSDKRLVDLGLKIIMIMCENNPKSMLSEFDVKG
jgi:hypothetical protein